MGLFQWLEVIHPSEEQMQELAKQWQIHPLAVEDCLHRNQRSKFEDFGVHQFLVVHAITEKRLVELHFVIRPDAIIMIADAAPPWGSKWSECLKIPVDHPDPQMLLYHTLDHVLDLSEKTVNAFYNRLFKIEGEIFSKKMNPQDLLHLRHRLGKAVQQSSALPSVLKQWIDFLNPKGELQWRLRDLWDHAERIRQSMDFYQQQTAATMDIYWGWTSKLANDQMEKLTALAAVFMPLTFWTGFFGMNFQALPFHSELFFVGGMAGMLLSVGTLYYLLRKRGYW